MISETAIAVPKIRRRRKVANDQVRTKAAAEMAMKTCEQIAAPGGSKKDLDEQTLFCALHTSGYWAGIWGRRRSVMMSADGGESWKLLKSRDMD